MTNYVGTIPFHDLAEAERASVPPPTGWTFQRGQRVDHADGSWPGTIMARTSGSRAGRFAVELAWVQFDAGPLLMMLTGALRAA